MHAIRNGVTRLLSYPFAVALALIGINSSITLIVNPGRSPVHQLLAPWDVIAAGIYGIGGLLIIVGIAFLRADFEAGGCIAFAGGALINAVVWMWIAGWTAWNTIAVLLMFSAAALIRARHITTGRVLLLVDTKDAPPQVVGPS
jgi:hypothetical protein